jgi:hypothetical protein
MLHFPIYRRRSMRLLKKYVISLKMTRTEDLHKDSFVKTIPTMMMIGMTISIMEILLLMMLLLCQQDCRLPHGHHHTSHLSSPCMMGTQIRSSFDELRSNHIFIWGQYRSHGEVFRHGSPKCGPDMVLFSPARDNHIMAEA